MRDWKEYQKEPDKFDYWLLKHKGYVRIGDNRTYIKIRYDIPECPLQFVCLYTPDNYEQVIEKIDKGEITEEEFVDVWSRIEFAGELIQAKLEDFRDASIYAMAGHYTDNRRIGVDNDELYKKYYKDLVEKL